MPGPSGGVLLCYSHPSSPGRPQRGRVVAVPKHATPELDLKVFAAVALLTKHEDDEVAEAASALLREAGEAKAKGTVQAIRDANARGTRLVEEHFGTSIWDFESAGLKGDPAATGAAAHGLGVTRLGNKAVGVGPGGTQAAQALAARGIRLLRLLRPLADRYVQHAAAAAHLAGLHAKQDHVQGAVRTYLARRPAAMKYVEAHASAKDLAKLRSSHDELKRAALLLRLLRPIRKYYADYIAAARYLEMARRMQNSGKAKPQQPPGRPARQDVERLALERDGLDVEPPDPRLVGKARRAEAAARRRLLAAWKQRRRALGRVVGSATVEMPSTGRARRTMLLSSCIREIDQDITNWDAWSLLAEPKQFLEFLGVPQHLVHQANGSFRNVGGRRRVDDEALVAAFVLVEAACGRLKPSRATFRNVLTAVTTDNTAGPKTTATTSGAGDGKVSDLLRDVRSVLRSVGYGTRRRDEAIRALRGRIERGIPLWRRAGEVRVEDVAAKLDVTPDAMWSHMQSGIRYLRPGPAKKGLATPDLEHLPLTVVRHLLRWMLPHQFARILLAMIEQSLVR